MDWIITIPAAFFGWVGWFALSVIGPIVFWGTLVVVPLLIFHAILDDKAQRKNKAKWAKWREENYKWVSGVG